ncbi:MAG: hypothetical protein NZ482_03635 [Gloeomargarita sp. SKYG98]|nr:hypothetical protein [Gloeomargarita sp. SKYG98]
MSTLTPEQLALAKQLGVPLSPDKLQSWLCLEIGQQPTYDKLLQRLASALECVGPVLERHKPQASLLEVYLHYPAGYYLELTSWFLSLPAPGVVLLLPPYKLSEGGYLNVPLDQTGSVASLYPEIVIGEASKLIDQELYKALGSSGPRFDGWVPSGYYQRFPHRGNGDSVLVFVPTDLPARYTALLLAATEVPDPVRLRPVLGPLVALARSYPELADAALSLAAFMLRHTTISSTKAALLLKELQSLLYEHHRRGNA